MRKFIVPLCIFLVSFIASATADVVWNEDFESLVVGTITGTNANVGNVQAANTLTSEVVEAPAEFTLGSGNVLLLSTGANNFSAIRPASSLNPINLPAIAEGLTWSISYDIFIPGNTDLVEGVGGIANFRWKDGGANNVNGPADLSGEQVTPGEYHIVYSGTFPVEIGNGPFLPTNARPFINFDQAGGAVNSFVYFDNLVFEVGVSDDDPNLAVETVNFGSLEQGQGPYVRNIVATNSGASTTLNITAAVVSGANGPLFTVSNTTFPLAVDPGESEEIEITFEPLDGIGEFTAELVVASNDESQPSTTLVLRGSVTPPFVGRELIVNGNFETGDVSGWQEDARYSFTATPTRNGSGAGAYTTVANQEFGSARLATTPPLGVQDDPISLVITPDMIGKNYEYSAWYYRPSVGGMEDTDQLSTIFRWNKSQLGNETHGNILAGDLPFDTWTRVFGQGVIPDVAGDGLATTLVEIIWSYRDTGADNAGGLQTFIDDVTFKVDVPPLDPVHPALQFTEVEVDEDAGVVRLTWASLTGAIYGIDRSTTLNGVWFEEVEDFVGTGDTSTWEDASALGLNAPRFFYRVRLVSLP